MERYKVIIQRRGLLGRPRHWRRRGPRPPLAAPCASPASLSRRRRTWPTPRWWSPGRASTRAAVAAASARPRDPRTCRCRPHGGRGVRARRESAARVASLRCGVGKVEGRGGKGRAKGFTHSMNTICALSPWRILVRKMRVYPPARSLRRRSRRLARVSLASEWGRGDIRVCVCLRGSALVSIAHVCEELEQVAFALRRVPQHRLRVHHQPLHPARSPHVSTASTSSSIITGRTASPAHRQGADRQTGAGTGVDSVRCPRTFFA